jgi:hypothetical protein
MALPCRVEINPVSGAMVDAKLANRTSDRLGIAEVSSGNPADPANDLQAGALIVQGGEPFCEVGCFANVDHAAFVIYGLQTCKQKM